MPKHRHIQHLLYGLISVSLLVSCGKSHVGYAPASGSYSSHKPATLPSGNGGYVKTGKPYNIAGKTYYPLASSQGYDKTGVASWYGKKFHGRLTANGERYDMHTMSAAHKTLPLPSMVRVTNLDNGRSVVVRVNDRGPFVKSRIIDLSYAAAKALQYDEKGTAHVRVQALDGIQHSTPRAVAQKTPAIQSNTTPPLQTTHISRNTKGGIYVQLGAFSSRINADRLRQQLAADHPNIRIHHIAQTALYRVRIGPYATVPESEEVILSLQQQGYDRAILVIE